MFRSLTLAVATLALGAGLALAEPEFRVVYPAGVTRVEISGDWAHSTYTVWRAPAFNGPWLAISQQNILCTGECYAEDPVAEPGRTYFYRFDLIFPDGSLASFGPYAAVISPTLASRLQARVIPNPARGATQVDLILAGREGEPALDAEATLFDLGGRAVKQITRGPLARGLTAFRWDGRDDRGQRLDAGLYFLRVRAGKDVRVVRVVCMR